MIVASMLLWALYVCLDSFSESYGLMINNSESLPYRLFIRVKGKPDPMERGALITFPHPLSKELLAKEIVGLPGDEIRIQNDHIYVNNEDVGEIKKTTSKQIPLQPILDKIVREGYVFVRGINERSFDSRYAEFGLVPIDNIQDKLKAIF